METLHLCNCVRGLLFYYTCYIKIYAQKYDKRKVFNLKAWKDGNLNVAYMQVRHPNWCAAQYQNWLDFGLPLEHPKVDPATQVFIFSGFWLVEHFGLRYVLVMMALELVEEIGAQLCYVLDKDDQLSWVLTVGEICVEEQNFIHQFSQKVSCFGMHVVGKGS